MTDRLFDALFFEPDWWARAVLAVLALACRCADRIVEAERLEAWSKGN